MKTFLLLGALLLSLSLPLRAEEPAAADPGKAVAEANAKAYEAAYAKGDAKALSQCFTEDVEYVSDDGREVKGRDAIEAVLHLSFLDRKGAKMAILVDSVQTLAPDVLWEKGTTRVTTKNGEVSGARYAAVHVKRNGEWKISQLVETPLPTLTPHEQLSELSWLVGSWEESDKENDLTITSQYAWVSGGNLITRNVLVKRAGETTLEGWQIIAWDPVAERIRSWTFDSEGGFSEGTWTRQGNRWLVRETGTTPDGARTAADNTFTKLSEERFTWESNNRTLNGDPQPGIGRIDVVRVKGK